MSFDSWFPERAGSVSGIAQSQTKLWLKYVAWLNRDFMAYLWGAALDCPLLGAGLIWVCLSQVFNDQGSTRVDTG